MMLACGRRKTRASAIAMVLAFITVVSIISVGISFMSSGRRRVEAMTMSDFRAFEIASSAIDFAARELALEQVFPGSPYRDGASFLELLRNDDEAGLRNVCSGCSEYRDLKDAEGKPAGKIWTAWTFPATQSARVEVTPVRELAQRDVNVLVVTPVTAHPLRYRRDLVSGRWQNWGVVRFESTVQVQDAFGKTTMTLLADRMFTVNVTRSDPQDGRVLEARLLVSPHDLRTGVRKS